jgi:hypothetical protein
LEEILLLVSKLVTKLQTWHIKPPAKIKISVDKRRDEEKLSEASVTFQTPT